MLSARGEGGVNMGFEAFSQGSWGRKFSIKIFQGCRKWKVAARGLRIALQRRKTFKDWKLGGHSSPRFEYVGGVAIPVSAFSLSQPFVHFSSIPIGRCVGTSLFVRACKLAP